MPKFTLMLAYTQASLLYGHGLAPASDPFFDNAAGPSNAFPFADSGWLRNSFRFSEVKYMAIGALQHFGDILNRQQLRYFDCIVLFHS
jgi:hypothetical protein